MCGFSDFGELDSFESSMYVSRPPRNNSENNLSSLCSQHSVMLSSSRPVDMPHSNFYGSDTSLNLSGMYSTEIVLVNR